MIDISNISKAKVLAALYNASHPQGLAKVLAALYNASHPQGLGFLYSDPAPMTEGEAQELLAEYTYFDYLKGRVMKIDLSGNELDPCLYDRDNGEGAAARAIGAVL